MYALIGLSLLLAFVSLAVSVVSWVHKATTGTLFEATGAWLGDHDARLERLESLLLQVEDSSALHGEPAADESGRDAFACGGSVAEDDEFHLYDEETIHGY